MPKPKRTPVLGLQTGLTPKLWTLSNRQVVMGIDPGLAALGVTVLSRESLGARPLVLTAETIKTEKAKKKDLGLIRVASDDQRRYREIWAQLGTIRDRHNPYAIGAETYTVGIKAASSGWKTGIVFGGIIFWAHCHNLFFATFRPGDLKKRFCGKQSASKEAVADALCLLVDGLAEALAAIPKTFREHVADAAGHAFLTLEAVDEARKVFGI